MAVFVSFPSTASPLALLIACLLFVVWTRSKNQPNRRTPLPPGPAPLPVIGNLRDLPTVQPWIIYTQWKKQYGDVVYCQALGQHVIILNSLKAVNELFEKRSHIYSDRPLLPMRDVLGWEFVLGLMHYGDEWRKNRRILHQKYKPNAALAQRPTQLDKIHEFLRNLISDPENFEQHYKYMTASIIMATAYGYKGAPKNDPFLENGEKAITMMTNSMFPGASIVNALPFLRYFPSWFPGSRFHQRAEECRKLTREMLDLPYEFVKKNMANGTATSSLISELIEENSKEGGSSEVEEMFKGLGATSYSAGADTVACIIGTFIYVASVNPEACKAAQQEIDGVIGGDRLPGYHDRPSLPYVEAFYREVMRWHPAFPLGVAHTVTEDDIYEGYFIPKGATIISNIWAITHDETKYVEPYLFKPERFLTAEGKLNDDHQILAFGFGRRVCIGRHAADASVWATIVSVLAVFDFNFAKDINGNAIPINGRYTDALISHVLPFQCSITPRSERARKLIEATN